MYLENLIKFKDSKFIFDVLLQRDKTARFVGGCVRNILLNLEVTDIDIGTTIFPDEVERMFNQYPNVKTINIGRDYGTIIVVVNSCSYEITTLRKDIATDGRYAVVEYTEDWQEDASRRDFTINCMSYSPLENKLYDYFNGQKDLKAGLIKFIGDPERRVQEDYLRIIRLFRFYAYCGKDIDQESLVACQKYAQCMKQLSQERKMKELYQIIIHKKYLETLQLMVYNNIIEHISTIPNWHSGMRLCKNLEKICSGYSYKLKISLKIFALFYKNNTSSSCIAKEFVVLSKEAKKYLISLSNFVQNTNLHEVLTKPYYFLYYYKEVLIDGFLYMQSVKLETEDRQEDDKVNFRKMLNVTKYKIPVFPLNGSALMSYFSLEPGKKLGKLLKIAKDFWIESEFKASEKQILSYVQKQL